MSQSVATLINRQVKLLINWQNKTPMLLRVKWCKLLLVKFYINRRVSQPVKLRNARRTVCPNV